MSGQSVRYSYYPGCSLHSTAREYNVSVRAVAQAAGVELVEVPDWNCCGATSAHATDPFLAFALPARVLLQAEESGLDILAPCAACYGRLMTAKEEAHRRPDLVARFEKAIGRKLGPAPRILNVLEFLAEPKVTETIAAGLKRPLTDLKVAPYYGCLLVRPSKVTRFDDAERPTSMDKILASVGATPVDFPSKTECCGASLGISRVDLVVELSGRIVQQAKHAGAEAIAVACPLCQTNLDGRQGTAAAKLGEAFGLPIYFITELVALALGVAPGRLGLGKHLTNSLALLRQKKLA